MTPEEWKKVSRIFHSVLEVPLHKRPAYLDKVCADDTTLRNEIESLLAANQDIGGFIEEPPSDFDAGEMPSLTGAYFGNYLIDGSLGHGGMGEVYRATDTRLHRRVALKKLPDRYTKDPVFVRRFENEARAAATLNHTNLATIYTVEEYEGKPFITMEYVPGKTLDALTPQGGLEIETFFRWFVPIAEGLCHAHDRGVIHRDIKPGNIMISDEGVPKILDFGLARVNSLGFAGAEGNGSTITDPGQIIGTPSYMSPEQAKGAVTDHRSDIFSLGVVMYEALTGRRPFTGESKAELITDLLRGEPENIGSIRREIPAPVADLVMRCLKKRRRDRPQSMRQVTDILSVSEKLTSADSSASSLAERLFPRSTSPSALWFVAGVVVVAAVAGLWYLFSAPTPRPIIVDQMSMRRLSQSNNVGGVALARDGKSFVYMTVEADAQRAMWTRRVDDSTPLQLVPPEPVQFWSRPVMSDDGGQVFYLTAGRAASNGTIYRISTLGGQPRKVVERVNHLGGLSGDGQRLLFVRYGPPTRVLSVNAADGSGETLIHEGPDNTTVYKDPRFSADGRTIFCVKHNRVDGVEYWSLVSIPAEGGPETEYFKQKEGIGEVFPLHDMSALLMTAVDPATNLHQIFHVSLPDGKRTRLTNDLNSYRGISVDQAGNIATVQITEATRVFVGPAQDPAAAKPLTKEPNVYGFLDWTPDGRIVYDAYENNKAHIWISDLSGKTTQLTDSASEDVMPRVSGDGRFIVFVTDRSGPHQVWRMNIDGSDPVLLANVPGWTEKPRFAADGRTVIFYWHDVDRSKLASVPVEGGKVETIMDMPEGYAYFWAMSPDGRYIASTYRGPGENRSRVAVRPTGSETPETILDIWPTSFLGWKRDGKSLFYREREGKGDSTEYKIFEIDLARRTPKLLMDADPDDVPDLAYSRDGKKIALVRGRDLADAVLLTGLNQK